MLEPIEITKPKTLQERIEQGGVIPVTRGPFAVPIAHRSECVQLQQIRLPNKLARHWWTLNFAAAQVTLGARRCLHCHYRSRSAPDRPNRVYRP